MKNIALVFLCIFVAGALGLLAGFFDDLNNEYSGTIIFFLGGVTALSGGFIMSFKD